VKLLEAREYIEKLEQRECSESDRHVTEIADSWAAGRRSGLEEGVDAGKAELLPQLERLQAHVLRLENADTSSYAVWSENNHTNTNIIKYITLETMNDLKV
jgi:hypothetical protein